MPDSGAAYDRAPCGLFTTAADGRIVRANRTFIQWTGLPASTLVGVERFQNLPTMGGRIFLQTHVAPLLQMQRSVLEVKLDMVRGDGTTVPVLVNICRTGETGAQFDEFAVMMMSDRHKYERQLVAARARAEHALYAKGMAEAALQVADRRKDEFLATLAHELRSPFSAMRTVIAILQKSPMPGADGGWPLQVLERQLAQASRLTDDLLDVSRIAEGKIEIRRTWIELGGVIRDVIDTTHVRHFSHGPSHILETSLPPEPIYLFADPVRLTQIVQNLLNNALRYTPPGGRVRLSVGMADSAAVITVSDDGVGIPAEDVATIFDMFAQAPSGGGRTMGGLGIGLALVRALVDLRDGTVTASIEGRGKGSSFEVRPPAAAQPPDPDPAAANAERVHTRGPRRLIVVEDNEDAAASLALLSELEGYTVRVATRGLSALRIADDFIPEAAILDFDLPDLDGRDVARRMRASRGNNILLIAVTGWNAEMPACETGLFDRTFTKPVDLASLLSALGGAPE
ncbi:ATP-binding protein [Paraburkholderia bryophila]|uniref:hybrid sensor histidine kinase/response regulator n=1 Tax=Paraburkholderia bryophila TaxID=420952 RepID=UPI00234B565C|nr:ATP-binding protein [Paraburkholderia bryophila]WCM18763.1 ATP-binding protein [Paraburkholderia bryophila]